MVLRDRKFAAAVCAGIVLGVLAGCSSDEGSAPGEGSADAQTQAVSGPPAALTPEPAVQAPETAPQVAEPTALASESAPPAPQEAAPAAVPAPSSALVDGGQQAAAPGTQNGDAKLHEVVARVTAYDPLVVYIQPGDTVRWTNMTGHDTEAIEGMIPERATGWKSKLGENYTVTLQRPGAYVYKCNPHVSLGMIGVVVVGEGRPANLPAIEAHPQNSGMIGRAVRKLNKSLQDKGLL